MPRLRRRHAQVGAYKFLRAGRVGPFTGFEWPKRTWVDAGSAVLCERGVHACRAVDLPYWLDEELWEVELGGAVFEGEFKLTAERGRLKRRLRRWNAPAYRALARDCADRARALADAHGGEVRRIADDIDLVLGRGSLSLVPFFAAVAAERAGGPEARVAERSRQADWLAAHVL